MSANKLRLGIVMAAFTVAMGGPALGVASTAIAMAESSWTGPDATDSAATVEAPVAELTSLASYDWI
jgi:hypothetical protein